MENLVGRFLIIVGRKQIIQVCMELRYHLFTPIFLSPFKNGGIFLGGEIITFSSPDKHNFYLLNWSGVSDYYLNDSYIQTIGSYIQIVANQNEGQFTRH